MRLRSPTLFAATLALTGLVAAPSTARAGGYYVADIEAVGLGQGGAFVAAPSTPMAIWYNPAALAHGRGLRLELGGGFIYSPLTYQRAPDQAMPSYPKVSNQQPFLPAALIGAAYDLGRLGLEDLTVALAAYTPTSSKYVLPEDGPQRFQSLQGTYRMVHIHAAVAYRLFRKIAVGVALGGSYFTATQRTLVSGAIAGDPESDAFKIPVNVSIAAPFTFTSNFGISAQPIPELALGASFMPPFDVHAPGTADISLPSTLAALATITGGDQIHADLHFPGVTRAGIRYTPTPRLSMEIAAVREGWGRLQTIDIATQYQVTAHLPPIINVTNRPLGTISLIKKYRDLYSVRLGVEGRPARFLTVRAGGWFESSGATPGYFDLSTPEANKVGASLGASLTYRAFALDLAYAHVFVPALTQSASKIQVVNVATPGNTRTLGNGTYDFSFDLLQIGLRAQLGR
jgi:long-chain fatty acid transport protein